MTPLLVISGSQTGTAHGVARQISRDARRRHIAARVVPTDCFDADDLPRHNVVVFVCATTGQGQEPDGMRTFWRSLLRRKLTADFLSSVQFAVVGLGDSSYSSFNFVAKRLWRRLLQLGARPLADRVDCDDQHQFGLYGALQPWLADSLWPALITVYPEQMSMDPLPEHSLLSPTVRVVPTVDGSKKMENSIQIPKGILNARLRHQGRLTLPTHFQDVRHMEFQLPEGADPYRPADVLSVLPVNSAESVDQIITALGWDADTANTTVTLDSTDDRELAVYVPRQTRLKLRYCLQHFVDYSAVPRDLYFFELLSHFVGSQMHADKLRQLCSPAGQDDLTDYCFRPRRTCLEVLQDFGPASVPVEYVFDLLPEMRWRDFSIASSPCRQPDTVSITVGVVHYRTVMKTPRIGMGSHWLAGLDGGSSVRAMLRRGTMTLPADSETPVIMIAPGLGIAPMRSLLHERVAQAATDNYLFHGFRYSSADRIYGREFDDMHAAKQLHYIPASSRDDPLNTVYVQHSIRRHGELLWTLVHEQGAFIYLSGNAKRMPDDVADALVEVFCSGGDMTVDAGRAYLEQLKRAKRFQQETWA